MKLLAKIYLEWVHDNASRSSLWEKRAKYAFEGWSCAGERNAFLFVSLAILIAKTRREDLIAFKFEAEMIHWRGPAPFYFVPLPVQDGAKIKALSGQLTYGWGVIPVNATIGGVVFRTSLFPKNATYLLPVKAEVRRKTNITAGDRVAVEMTMQPVAP